MNPKSSVFLSLYFIIASSYAESLDSKVNALIQKTLPLATVSIVVQDAETQKIIYSKQSRQLSPLASNAKLFTAAAVFYRLNLTDHIDTTLSHLDNNIYVTFNGSPSLTTNAFINLIGQLKQHHINAISGNIVIDSTRFKPPYHAGGLSYDDLGWYYAAPSTAIILDDNAEAFEFISAKKIGLPVQIKPQKSQSQLTIINQIITVDKQQAKEHCNLNVNIQPNNTLKLYGCLAQTERPVVMKLAVPDPMLSVKKIIRDSLKAQGITLKGNIIEGKTPQKAMLLASTPSDSYFKLIQHMLQESDNLYADSLTKQLGFIETQTGTYKQGVFAIKKILSKHTHLNFNTIDLSDGLGSRYNLATAEQMTILLADIYHNKTLYPQMLQALPKAGISGSLKARFKKTHLEKSVFAKTGTMHDISSLSGYIVRPNQRPLIFSILINGINQPISIVKKLEEDLLLLIP